VRVGATVTRAVLDDRVDVGERAVVGGDGNITLIGGAAAVAAGTEVPSGARVPEPDDEG
jgi:glucose-1-phosphate adenylyltransferase